MLRLETPYMWCEIKDKCSCSILTLYPSRTVQSTHQIALAIIPAIEPRMNSITSNRHAFVMLLDNSILVITGKLLSNSFLGMVIQQSSRCANNVPVELLFYFWTANQSKCVANSNPLLCLMVNLPLRAETDIMTGGEFMATRLCNWILLADTFVSASRWKF